MSADKLGQTELALYTDNVKSNTTNPDIKLYDYQLEALNKFKTWYKSTSSQEALIALATGLGKTLTASACVKQVIDCGGKVLWITHRDELITQSAETLQKYTGVYVGIEKAELHAAYASKIVVASVQTLKGKRLKNFAKYNTPSLIVFDEAHHSIARTWLAIKLSWPEAKILNLTATPYRQDIGRRLNLGEVLIEMNTSDGIKMGRLVPPKPVGSLGISLNGVKISMGDYETTSLVAVLMRPEILEQSIKLISDNAHGHKSIVFAANIEHGKILAKLLREQGFGVEEIYAETPRENRISAYEGIKNGTIDILVNNMVLTEGFDLPQIDLVAILRPTRNAALYLQMLGRGLRTCTGKSQCLVIDAADVAKKKVGESDLILPTEEHRKKYSAMLGRQAGLIEVFLSWCYKTSEVSEYLQDINTPREFTKIKNGFDLFKVICPTADFKELRQAQINMITSLTNYIVESRSAKDRKVFSDFAALVHCGHIEALVSILANNGWQYYPNGTLPKNEEEDALIAEENENALAFTEENFNIRCLSKIEPSLQNFVLDVIQSESMSSQAKKYFNRYDSFGIMVSWSIPMCAPDLFTYVRLPTETPPLKEFFVRITETGEIYNIHLYGAKINRVEKVNSTSYFLQRIPSYSKNTAWTKNPATENQLPHVARILGVTIPEAKKLGICAMAAASLLDNKFSKAPLAAIAKYIREKIQA